MNRNAPTKNLTRKQVRALRALLREPSIDKAATVAGVDQSSIDRWLKDPIFYNALIDAEWQLIEEGIRQAASDLSESMKVLSEIMRDTTAANGVRVRAATAIADSLTKLHGHRQLHKLNSSTPEGDDWIAAGEDSNGDDDQEAEPDPDS